MDNAYAPTIFREPPPTPFPSSPSSVDLSPLEFILALLAVVTIPALIYAFFFAVKCPPRPFRRRLNHDDRDNRSSGGDSSQNGVVSKLGGEREMVSAGVTYKKDAHVKEVGSECPVCLSVFAEGEEVKQLSACKHSFHAPCIDMWLKSHSNCPICRASVPVKRPVAPPQSSRGGDDFHQGLPDSANLV